jgi:FkbM family methyltransferase
MSIFSDIPHRESVVCSTQEPVFIFGAGGFGRSVAKACASNGITVKAFIQTTPTADSIDGIAVRSWIGLSEYERNLPLLIGIFNRDTPFDGLVTLASNAGFHRIILPYDIYAQFGKELGWRYWLSGPDLIRKHATDLNDAYDLLADEESKKCLEQLVMFRLGLNLSYSSFTHNETQYFNSISLSRFKGAAIRYVDIGAYNGDSFFTLKGIQEVASALLLEPDSDNFASLVSSLRSAGQAAICLPLGGSANHELRRFQGAQGEAAHLDPLGDQGIVTVALDDCLQGQNIDLIKLDIEGSELSALTGASRILNTEKPNLAVSCYHRPDDVWVLSNLIRKSGDYNFYMRQHAYNSFELVLYAVH